MRSTRKVALIGAVAGARVPAGARATALTIVALAAVSLAGCGGDDEGGGGSNEGSGGMSKAEFVAKADAICAEANRKELAIVREGPGWLYSPKFSDPKLMTRFTAVGRDALRRLEALEPPEEARADVRAVVGHIQTSLKAIEQEIADQRAGKRGRTSKNLQVYETAYGDVAASAGRAGFNECQGVSF